MSQADSEELSNTGETNMDATSAPSSVKSTTAASLSKSLLTQLNIDLFNASSPSVGAGVIDSKNMGALYSTAGGLRSASGIAAMAAAAVMTSASTATKSTPAASAPIPISSAPATTPRFNFTPAAMSAATKALFPSPAQSPAPTSPVTQDPGATKPLDPMFTREVSASQAVTMIQQLVSKDTAMSRVITSQRLKLLHGSGAADLTYTMCALSDDIVCHLATWMKTLPFYPYLAAKQCTDLLASAWGSMLLFTTSLNKAWLLQGQQSTPAPDRPPLPMLKAEDGDSTDEQEVAVDSDPQQRQLFYELLRNNMRSLHSHVVAVLQREVKFGEVYDAMGMMTDRITHIVHRMRQLHITPQETACLKVILLLLQGML